MPSVASLLIKLSVKSSPRIIAAVSRSNSLTMLNLEILFLLSSVRDSKASKARMEREFVVTDTSNSVFV